MLGGIHSVDTACNLSWFDRHSFASSIPALHARLAADEKRAIGLDGLGKTAMTRKGISDMRSEQQTPTKTDDALPDLPAPRPRKLIALHWLTVFCLVAAVAFVLIRDQVDARTARQWLLEGHRHFGLFVLLLFLVRVAVRIRLGKLPATADTSWLLRCAAGLTHIVLYALLLAQPLLGWALSNAEGKPVHLLGLTLPALVGADEDLADSLQAWHLDTAWVLLALASLHIAAALWHHFVLRDGVLRAMWPRRRPS